MRNTNICVALLNEFSRNKRLIGKLFTFYSKILLDETSRFVSHQLSRAAVPSSALSYCRFTVTGSSSNDIF